MMYVYCANRSQGAYELVQELGATRLRKFDGMDFWRRGKRFFPAEGDVIVCWGRPIPELEGVRVLNGGVPSDKLKDCIKLANMGVRTLQVSQTKGKEYGYAIGRTKYHQGGSDLIRPPNNPDFYVAKYNFSKEYRMHSFAGKSIRAGEKVLRDGWVLGTEEEFQTNLRAGSPNLIAHPWVRSFDAGWKISYDGFQSNGKLRTLAHSAVKALGLAFGAVDIGVTEADNLMYVIEVNRAPGIEGGSVQSYVRAITKWVEKKEEKDEEEKVEPTPLTAEEHAALIQQARPQVVFQHIPAEEPVDDLNRIWRELNMNRPQVAALRREAEPQVVVNDGWAHQQAVAAINEGRPAVIPPPVRRRQPVLTPEDQRLADRMFRNARGAGIRNGVVGEWNVGIVPPIRVERNVEPERDEE